MYYKIVIPSTIEELEEFCMAYSDVDEIEIKDGVTKIPTDAFYCCERLKKISIPKSVTDIDDESIGYSVDENASTVQIDGVEIYGKKGSAAQTYAKENNFKFTEN